MSDVTKKKRSFLLLLAAIIATLCFVYVVSYASDSMKKMESMSSAEQVGTSIAMAMASPSMIVSGIGTLFAWLGWLFKIRGFALTAGILFAVAMVLMIPWFMFNVVQMVLCFIAFARMKAKGQ